MTIPSSGNPITIAMRSRADGVLEHVPSTGDTTAPVVTPPSDTTIQFANGGAGLAHNDPALQSWLAQASAVDDTDGAVAVTNNLASQPDPLPAGTVAIQFSATDSAGNVGTATANLTVQEAAVTSGIIFYDGFESGDLSHVDPNTGAFWDNSAYVDVLPENPYAGNYSLRHRYQDPDGNGEAWSEQRFDLNGKYPEVWIDLRFYIPSNFSRSDVSPARNNKFMYVDSRKTPETNNVNMYTGFEMWGHQARIGCQQAYQDSTSIGWIWSNTANGELYLAANPSDLGRWHHLVFHLKKEAAPGDNNGIVRVWHDDVLYFDYTNLDNYSAGYNHYETGYLMGYANHMYDNDPTYFYLDEVKFSTSPPSGYGG